MVPPEAVDLQAALAGVGHSRALLLPMIRHIRQLDVGPLVAAAEAGDLGRARSLAHRMGGEALYLRAGAAAACAALSTIQATFTAATAAPCLCGGGSCRHEVPKIAKVSCGGGCSTRSRRSWVCLAAQ